MNVLQKADGFEAQKLIVLPHLFVEDVSLHPLAKSMYITDIGFFPHALYHYRERPYGCNSHIFIFCVEGEGWVSLEKNTKLPIHKNTLLIIPAHTPHIYGASKTDPWSIYWFHLQGDEVEHFIQSFDMQDAVLHVPVAQAMKITNLFEECYTILSYKGYSLKHYVYVSQAMRHLLGMFMLLHDDTQQDSRKNEVIEQSIQYMIEHVQSSLTLDELASHINLSKPHFIHLFKQVTNYSPIDYYLRLKIQHSCQHLELTNATIKEVSKNIGIDDPYYFSRLFRKIIGQSPSDYRKTKQN